MNLVKKYLTLVDLTQLTIKRKYFECERMVVEDAYSN